MHHHRTNEEQVARDFVHFLRPDEIRTANGVLAALDQLANAEPTGEAADTIRLAPVHPGVTYGDMVKAVGRSISRTLRDILEYQRRQAHRRAAFAYLKHYVHILVCGTRFTNALGFEDKLVSYPRHGKGPEVFIASDQLYFAILHRQAARAERA